MSSIETAMEIKEKVVADISVVKRGDVVVALSVVGSSVIGSSVVDSSVTGSSVVGSAVVETLVVSIPVVVGASGEVVVDVSSPTSEQVSASSSHMHRESAVQVFSKKCSEQDATAAKQPLEVWLQ